jgi:hypothetical protein
MDLEPDMYIIQCTFVHVQSTFLLFSWMFLLGLSGTLFNSASSAALQITLCQSMGIDARTVSTLALAVRCSNHSAIYLVTYSEEAEAVGMEQNC